MRRAAAFAIFLFLFPAAAQAESWRIGGGGGQRPNRFISFIDAERIVRTGDTVTYWELQTLESPDRTGTIRQLVRYWANCRTREHRGLDVTYYKADGRVNHYGADERSSVAGAGSVIASVIETACGVRPLREQIGDPENMSRAYWRANG
jgi:hypothetical protein